jgi:putative DNA primase/helicase
MLDMDDAHIEADAAASQPDAELMAALDGPDVDPTLFLRTDAGNALLFVALVQENVRYIEPWQAWIVWNGRRWETRSDTGMLPLTRRATEYMLSWASGLPEDQRAGLRQHALASQKGARLRSILNLAKGQAAIRIEPERLDANPMLLGCSNGTLHLRTGKLRSPARGDFITKSTGITYDPEAECRCCLETIEWVTGRDCDTIDHLQRCAGYMLTGRVIEEKLFAFFGGGANGKTTVAMTMLDAMGDYAGKARKDLLLESQCKQGAASPDVAALHGRRLVVISETDRGCALAEAQVKEITSNEPIAARKLHRDPFTFRPSHKILLLTNYRPFITGSDEGIWRRLNIVEFNASLPEKDRYQDFRESKLRPELKGILAWMVRGCLRWQRDGLKPSAAVRQAISAYRFEMDFVAQWLDDRCESDAQATTPRAAAYDDYQDWAEREHFPTIGNRRFVEELRSRGFLAAKSGGVRLFKGLKLKAANFPTLRVVGGTQGP